MSGQRPKILFCMHMPPPVHGAAMIGKYIHDSSVINTSFECRYVNIATASSVNDIGKGGWRKFCHILQKRREIVSVVRQFKPNLVYITPNSSGGAFYKDFLFVQQLKWLHCRVVLHFHNKGVASDTRKGIKRWLYQRFFAGTQVILLSELLYHDIAAFVPRTHVYICPNGIPNVDVRKEGHEHDVPNVFFLSNLLRAKGIYTLLEACSLLNRRHVNFHCDIVGDEGDVSVESLLHEIHRYNLQDCIKYNGPKTSESKQRFFDAADIFVLPTENDCFPLVLLEAMRSGVACISTPQGAIPEILENGRCGLIINSHDANALAEAIHILLNDQEARKRLAENGREKFIEKYSLPIFEQRMRAILTDVIKTSGLQ